MKLRSKLIGQKKASQKDEDKSECYEEWASEDEDNEGATGDDDEDSGEGESEDESLSKVMNEVVAAEAAASVSTSDKVKCPISEVSEPKKVLFSGVNFHVIDELMVEYELEKVRKHIGDKGEKLKSAHQVFDERLDPSLVVVEGIAATGNGGSVGARQVFVKTPSQKSWASILTNHVQPSGMRRIQKVWKFSAKTGCLNQVFLLKVLCGFVIDMETALQGAARQAQDKGRLKKVYNDRKREQESPFCALFVIIDVGCGKKKKPFVKDNLFAEDVDFEQRSSKLMLTCRLSDTYYWKRKIDDDNYIGVHSFIGLTDERGKRQRPTTSIAEVKPKVEEIDVGEGQLRTVVNRLVAPNLQENNLNPYLQLHIASVQGDWETADRIISNGPGVVRAPITGFLETSLIVAVRSKRRNQFTKNLLLNMEPVDLETKDIAGMTALHSAVIAANLIAIEMLVQKNPNLPNIAGARKLVPLHTVAKIGNREMVVYLLGVTKEDMEPRPFEGERGAKLLRRLVFNGHYDIAIKVMHKYPNIALGQVLAALATKRSAFRSGTKLNIWERLLYRR
ncbi:hypothetical protein U1Q18_015125 [Sarracenia purpurea var. burkii]